MPRTTEEVIEEMRQEEMNAKLDQIIDNTKRPSFGGQLVHKLEQIRESQAKELQAKSDEKQKELNRPGWISAVLHIFGGAVFLVGLIFLGEFLSSPYSNPNSIGIGIVLVGMGSLIVRM
jgi:hypothetical protein